eukprot:2277415-Prymnesium_polylepis.1
MPAARPEWCTAGPQRRTAGPRRRPTADGCRQRRRLAASAMRWRRRSPPRSTCAGWSGART